MLTFGSVIKCGAEEYVYLATIGEIVYLAKILDDKLSRSAIEMRERIERRSAGGSSSAQRELDKPLLSFIVLTTEEFQDRVANFGNPGKDQEFVSAPENLTKLNETDLSALKSEIVDNKGVPRELIDFVAKL